MLKRIILAIALALGLLAGITATPDASAIAYVQKKEQTVYVTRTGKKYHLGDCRYLRQSKIPIKKSQAIREGYTACKVCRP